MPTLSDQNDIAWSKTPVSQPIIISEGRAAICRDVLESLPEWFGIPASIERYVSAADQLPMLACRSKSEIVGFVSVKVQTPFAADLYVIGIKRPWHRSGIGRSLVDAADLFAARQGARFLTVKTVSPARDDENYAATRRFYEAVGFLPIEEFPTLWGVDNPCLLMLRPVRAWSCHQTSITVSQGSLA